LKVPDIKTGIELEEAFGNGNAEMIVILNIIKLLRKIKKKS